MTQGLGGWMPPLIGPVVIQGDGVDAEPATIINFVRCRAVWNEGQQRLDITSTGIAGDADGLATITATQTSANEGTLRGFVGAASTPNASVLEVALPGTWAVAANDVWSLEVYAVAKSANAAVRRRIKVTCVVYGNGATATLDDDPVVDPIGTGNATVTVSVSGSAMRVELTPVDATPLTWRFEVRGQKL